MTRIFQLSIDMSGADFNHDQTRAVANILATAQEELEGGATQNEIRDSAGRSIGGWLIQDVEPIRQAG